MNSNVLRPALIFSIALLFFLSLSFFASGQALNAGFASSLWYSKDPFFAGERIRLYTAFQNHSGYDLTGKIGFFDNEKLIGETDFAAVNNSLVEKWADWQASFGEHSFTVRLSDVKKSEPGKESESVNLSVQASLPDRKFVDYDTDQDGLGDSQDPDDDNDDLTDDQEILFKTNPKESDTDKDGLSDSQEVKQGTDPLVQEKGFAGEKIVLPEQFEETTVKALGFIEKQRQGAIAGLSQILAEQKQEVNQAGEQKAWLEPQIKSLNQKLPFVKIPEKILAKSNLLLAGVSLLITVLETNWLFWLVLLLLILFCFKAIRFFWKKGN